MKKFFLRNDDVRGSLDDSLLYLTDRVLENKLCITHAVEPANVSDEVIEWLLALKEQYPKQIEIIQHGYSHTPKTYNPLGEFGGNRGYREQLKDIESGMTLLNTHFGSSWFRAFSFPFGVYDRETLIALEALGFKAISTGIRWTWKRKVLNRLGMLLRRKFLIRPVVYDCRKPPGYNLFEIPVSLNTTARYLQPDGGVQKDHKALIAELGRLPSQRCLGILSHHRFNSTSDSDSLVNFMISLRTKGWRNATLEDLYGS